MNVRRFAALGLAVLFVIVLFNCNGTYTDHFKVYFAKKQTPVKEFQVKLQDQFDKQPLPSTVWNVNFFANPVSKDNGKISDSNAHLTWYQIRQIAVRPRKVEFENQFGKQKCELGEATYLLVPTHKIETGSAMPKRLNHFKAYKVLKSDSITKKVTLVDQFDKKLQQKETVFVSKLMYFCTPVEKNREPIYDKENHLAVYLIKSLGSEHLPKNILIRNQFGADSLYVEKSYMLAVPTKKLSYSE